jgi:hypothetical protein
VSKSTKPLTIAVHPAFLKEPWVQELRDKGHRVFSLRELNCENVFGDPSASIIGPDGCDLILAPQAARFLPGMHKYLDSFIKGARVAKYGANKKAEEE